MVTDGIFRKPARRVLSKANATVLGNSNRFIQGFNCREVLSNILLHLAADNSDYELARLLLEQEGHVNSTNRQEQTALHKAAFKPDYELVKLLLEKGADSNHQDIHGQTALHIACQRHDVTESNCELIRLLLDKGADVTRKDIRGKTFMHIACQTGSADLIKFLTENSPECIHNLLDYAFNSPFNYACRM